MPAHGLDAYTTKQFQRQVAALPSCNLIVLGRTGAGKSTLVNAVFGAELARTGSGRPVTRHITAHTTADVPLTLLDTPGVELGQDVEDVIGDYTAELERRARRGESDHLHMLWYCVHAECRRLEPFEERLIDALSRRIPTVMVVTQCLDDDDRLIRHARQRGLPVVPVLAQARTLAGRRFEPRGLDRLIETTARALPGAIRRAFHNAQRIQLDDKEREALAFVESYAGALDGRTHEVTPAVVDAVAGVSAIFGATTVDERMLLSLVRASVAEAPRFSSGLLVTGVLAYAVLAPAGGSAALSAIASARAKRIAISSFPARARRRRRQRATVRAIATACVHVLKQAAIRRLNDDPMNEPAIVEAFHVAVLRGGSR